MSVTMVSMQWEHVCDVVLGACMCGEHGVQMCVCLKWCKLKVVDMLWKCICDVVCLWGARCVFDIAQGMSSECCVQCIGHIQWTWLYARCGVYDVWTRAYSMQCVCPSLLFTVPTLGMRQMLLLISEWQHIVWPGPLLQKVAKSWLSKKELHHACYGQSSCPFENKKNWKPS